MPLPTSYFSVEKFNEVMRQSLNLPNDFSLEMAEIGSLSQWSSLKHIKLIMDLEKAFGIKVPVMLIQSTTSYKNLVVLFESLRESA